MLLSQLFQDLECVGVAAVLSDKGSIGAFPLPPPAPCLFSFLFLPDVVVSVSWVRLPLLLISQMAQKKK